MRRAYIPFPGQRLALHDDPMPTPGVGEAVIRMSVATICAGTDLAIIDGLHPPHDAASDGMLPHELRGLLGTDHDELARYYPTPPASADVFPAPMGHEAAATITALGPEANSPEYLVFADEPLAVGDRVGTFKVPGAYGDYAPVTTSNLVKLPPEMSDDEGSMLEPLLINFNCLARCFSIRPARTVAVLGQGCQGLLAMQVVRALGATRVIVSEPEAHKRALALELGADAAIDPAREHVVEAIRSFTGGEGADLVVEAAGVEETIRAAPYCVRLNGMIAQIGAITEPVTFDYGYVHFRHFIVVPTDYFATLRDVAPQVREIIDLVVAGRVKLAPLITHRFPLDRLNDAFDALRDGGVDAVKVAVDIE